MLMILVTCVRVSLRLFNRYLLLSQFDLLLYVFKTWCKTVRLLLSDSMMDHYKGAGLSDGSTLVGWSGD